MERGIPHSWYRKRPSNIEGVAVAQRFKDLRVAARIQCALSKVRRHLGPMPTTKRGGTKDLAYEKVYNRTTRKEGREIKA